MPVVYIDVIWLVNLVLDGFILLIAAFLARRAVRRWRMIGASAIGASYALFLFIPQTSFLMTFFCKFLFSILMVWVAFRPKGLLDFGKMLGLFYLASFVSGGAAYAANGFFHNMTFKNGLVLISGRPVWLQQSSLFLILLALPVVWLLGKSAWNRLGRARHREQNLWTVHVSLSGHDVTFPGLLDTGNALTDPLSRTPVMVADWELFREVLPPALTALLEKGTDIATVLGEVEMEDDWQARFRLVPYRGVGGTMGMLLSFRPDEVLLTEREKPGPEHACRRILVGLNPKPLAADGSYRAILHPSMIGTEAESRMETQAS